MDARELMAGMLETLDKEQLIPLVLDGLAFGAAILNITIDNRDDEYEMGCDLTEYMVESGLVAA